MSTSCVAPALIARYPQCSLIESRNRGRWMLMLLGFQMRGSRKGSVMALS